MKHLMFFSAVFFSGLVASANVPVWMQVEMQLVKESAVALADNKSCALKLNVLGQVEVIARVLPKITKDDPSLGADFYELAFLLQAYGVDTRFERLNKDVCARTDQESMEKIAELIRAMEEKLRGH
jgi:hypothetical protein